MQRSVIRARRGAPEKPNSAAENVGANRLYWLGLFDASTVTGVAR